MSPLQLHLVPQVKPVENSTDETKLHQPSSSFSFASPIQLYSTQDQASRAELIWALKTVSSNYSAASCDGISDIFNSMFPGAMPAGFSLGRTKLSYLITDALGPYFHEEMLKDAQESYFSLEFDETTNVENQKELQVAIRYWSNKLGRVLSKHLETFFLGHATGAELSKYLFTALDNSNLLLTNMLFLGSDGPNVNKTVHRIVNEEVLKRRGSGLLNLGTCNIHIVHNAFLKGLAELGEECSDAAIAIFHFFDGFPSRWEDYSIEQGNSNVPKRKFIRHVTSRWLTLRDSCERVLEQSTSLERYFLNFIPKNHSSLMATKKYKTIASFLKNPVYKAELCFVVKSADLFRGFTKRFQKEEPLIHIMYDELRNISMTLINRVCKTEISKELNTKSVWDKEKIFMPVNLVEVKKVVVNSEVECYLEGKPEKEVLFFLKGVQQHYIASCKHLLMKSSLSSPSAADFLRYLRFLQPKEKNSVRSCTYLVKVAKALPTEIPTDILQDEWKALQLEKVDTKLEKMPVDEFWQNFISMENPDGTPKFPTVSKVVKMCLTLSHGSADVERGFSQSGRILTDDKGSMSLRMLNARRNIKDKLKSCEERPELIPVTKELLSMARSANAAYKSYLEKQKLEELSKLKKKEEEEERLRLEKENAEEVRKRKSAIDKMQSELKKLKKDEDDKRKTNEKLFEVAQAKLNAALNKNDLEEAKVAQAMLEGVKVVKEQEKTLHKKIENVQSQLDKKQLSVITQFFKKK